MKVWVTSTRGSRFHVPGCTRLQRMAQHTVQELDLDEVVGNHEPCRLCWPAAPRPPKVWRPSCKECYGGKQGPCPHNGGVLVLVEQRGKWPGQMGIGTYDPNGATYRRAYVWPENAYKYRPVEEDPLASNPRATPDLRDRQRR